mgnify:CR=1 FL=1
MALNIATDTAFLLASKSSDRNTVTLNQSMERLTSGLRINSASDDAAGVAVATRINLLEFIEDREAFGLHILKRILLVAVAFVAGSKIIAVKFDNDSTNSLSMSRVILCLKCVPR